MKHILSISIVALLLAVPMRGQDLNRDSVPVISMYKHIDEMPEFPGGEEKLRWFVKKNLIYPIEAWNDTNYKKNPPLHFIVRKDGVACGLQLQDAHPSLYKEWKRLFDMMPLWTPAKNKRVPFDVEHTLYDMSCDDKTNLPFHIVRLMKEISGSDNPTKNI